MKYNRIVCLLFALLFAHNLYGQKKNFIAVTAYVTTDSVMLRWAPSDYETWQKGIKYGYRVERILLSKDGKIPDDNRINILHNGVLLPLPVMAWEPVVRKDTVWAPIALQALWGDTFELTSSFKTNIMQAYNKVRENESRFGFAMYSADRSITVAKALGVYWSDRITTRSEKYIYKVYINMPDRSVEYAAYTTVDLSKPTELFKPRKAEVYKYGDRVIVRYKPYSNDYIGYYFERSSDGKNFQRITKNLVTPIQEGDNFVASYSDSIMEGKRNYYYRVIGLSPFGFEGSSSDTSHITISKGIAPPTNVQSFTTPTGGVNLTWRYDSKTAVIKGFKVLRSPSASGRYVIIDDNIRANQRSWIDSKPLPSSYYKVAAISTTGAESESLESFVQLADSIPPLPPTVLDATIDSNGVVKLSWKANDEADLMGYRVFRSNNKIGEYVQISKNILCKPQYVDTISVKTLTKKVFYKLVALDKRYNASDFSQPFSFNRPDLVPPAPPVLTRVSQTTKGVQLEWTPSPSNDVAYVELFKRVVNQPNDISFGKVSYSQREFIDTTTINNDALYEYWAVAVDSAGNTSIKSNQFRFSCKKAGAEYDLKFTAKVVVDGTPSVLLTWILPTTENTIYLYRKEEGKVFCLLKTLTDVSSLNDVSVIQGKYYDYMIVCKGCKNSTVRIGLH